MTKKIDVITSPQKLIELGHAILDEGLPVFICGSVGKGRSDKAPLDASIGKANVLACISEPSPGAQHGKSGCYLYTRSKKDVERLAHLKGAKYWGVPMGEPSGLFAVDPDIYKGGTVVDWYEANKGWLETTRTHTTMSGGTHHIFEWDGNLGNPNLAQGVETRGNGGYIIWSGNPGYVSSDNQEIQPLPPEFHSHLKVERDRSSALTLEQRLVAIAADQEWHEHALKISASVMARGLDANEWQSRILDAMDLCIRKYPQGNHGQARKDAMLAGELDRLFDGAGKKYAEDVDGALIDALNAAKERAAPQEELTPSQIMARALLDDGEGDTQAPKPEPGTPSPVGGAPSSSELPPGVFWGNVDPEIRAPYDGDLVEHMLAKGKMAVLYGASSHGKSWAAVSMACSIATGTSWMGRQVRQGPVLYIGAEDPTTVRERVMAHAIDNGLEGPMDLLIWAKPIDFRKSGLAANKDFQRVISLRPWALIIIDTVGRAGGGETDLSDQKDWHAITEAVDLVRYTTGCCVMLVHHSNKQGTLFGSVYATNDADHIFECQRSEAGVFQLINRKQRNMSMDNLNIYFQLSEPGVYVGDEVRPSGEIIKRLIPVAVHTTAQEVTDEESDEDTVDRWVSAMLMAIQGGLPGVSQGTLETNGAIHLWRTYKKEVYNCGVSRDVFGEDPSKWGRNKQAKWLNLLIQHDNVAPPKNKQDSRIAFVWTEV